MLARLRSWFWAIMQSFWFVPAAITLACALASYSFVEIDRVISNHHSGGTAWLYEFSAQGARSILSSIAGSMITVAGLTFSITMLTLQVASSQFGPRLLPNFMRDRGNQLVMGAFIGTFVYCLMLLRKVHGVEGKHFVPSLSVTVGVLLGLVSISLLIYFIHHVANSIRIETILDRLVSETLSTIDRRFPDPYAEATDDSPLRVPAESDHGRPIKAKSSGYVQHVDSDALLAAAKKHEVFIDVKVGAGSFVWGDETVATAFPATNLPDETSDDLRAAITVGADRSADYDVDFSLWRIVEIGQRSLSPGVNDPTTAISCLDRLGEVLGRLSTRQPQSPVFFDKAKEPRLRLTIVSFPDLVVRAFAAILRYGLQDPDVVKGAMAALDKVSKAAPPKISEAIDGLQRTVRDLGNARNL